MLRNPPLHPKGSIGVGTGEDASEGDWRSTFWHLNPEAGKEAGSVRNPEVHTPIIVLNYTAGSCWTNTIFAVRIRET